VDNEEAIMSEESDQQHAEVKRLLDQALSFDKDGQYEQMLTMAQEASELDPGSALALACQARALQKLERISEATIANDQALLLDTTLPLAWLNRGGLQLLQERYQDSLRSVERAIELAPADARPWANKAIALLALKNPVAALDAVNYSLALDPDYLFALRAKGEILYELKRMRELIPLIQQLLESASRDEYLLALLIRAYRFLGEYGELLPLTGQLIELDPDDLFAWDSHTRALRALGHFEEAEEAIEQFLELIPDDEHLWTMKADTLYRLGRYREAVQAAEQAIGLNGNYPPAWRVHDKAARLMYQRKDQGKNHKPRK